MSLLAQDSGPGLSDNLVLDEFEIPFGQWVDQAVDWIATRLGGLLDAIVWPFEQLITFIVRDTLAEVSWIWVVLAMGLIAALVRNIKVGVFVAVALTICGLLGNAYWIETARTIGFIAVAVFFCVLIGIPIGVACGRFDGVWQMVRPILDAMQVVHSFVYMLPVIFFWGIGEVSATMVTMVFAIPPLIRLTNLGIRQVPEDVVEASRAYGSSELRVLMDVQLPLARPAIMTGINQTLLLAISMLGIAAIMGAGGLGRLMFRALSNQDVPLAASSGLAFFLVAVVLDRMSQREDSDGGNLFGRIAQAWSHRKDPEVLMVDDGAPAVEIARPEPADVFAAVSSNERLRIFVTVAGAVLGVISVFLPWTSNAGKFSAFGRRDDEELLDLTFNGLEASGGSWFGYLVLAASAFVILAALKPLRSPGRGPRWLSADGALIASMAGLIVAVAHVLGSTAPLAVDPGNGIGVILAIVGLAIATAGALWWTAIAPHSALRPLSADVAWGRFSVVVVAGAVLVGAMFSGWSFDTRRDVVITPEVQAQIDELRARAVENPSDQAEIGAEIAVLMATVQNSDVIVTDGVTSSGSRLGLWSLLIGLIAVATMVPAIGALGRDEHRQWRWSSVTAGIGAGVAGIGMAWIMTQVRTADANYVSGIGAFLALSAGVFMVASTLKVLKTIRRSKVYEDLNLEDEQVVELDEVLVDSMA